MVCGGAVSIWATARPGANANHANANHANATPNAKAVPAVGDRLHQLIPPHPPKARSGYSRNALEKAGLASMAPNAGLEASEAKEGWLAAAVRAWASWANTDIAA